MASPTPMAQAKAGNQKASPNKPSRPSTKGNGVAQRMQNISPSKPSPLYDMSAAKKRVR